MQPAAAIGHLTREEDGMAPTTVVKKQSAAKASTRKYSPATGKSVETEMRAMNKGELKSGRSGKTVTNPKQAIAIGLSKARKEGKKVPPPKA
jgi:hypothetical protein